MNIRTSLKQRIVVMFALMSTLVAGVFAIGIVWTVHVVETKLTTISLGGSLHRLMNMANADDWSHRPERDELFFAQQGTGDMALPQDLLALPLGFQEIHREGRDYYVIVEAVDERRYVLLRDQRSFEKRERTLFGVVFAGFVISVLLAILLGRTPGLCDRNSVL